VEDRDPWRDLQQVPPLASERSYTMTTMSDTATVLSEEMLQRFAQRAPMYDRENRFFTEDFEELGASGYLKLPIPCREHALVLVGCGRHLPPDG
jgi:hypothetical protein